MSGRPVREAAIVANEVIADLLAMDHGDDDEEDEDEKQDDDYNNAFECGHVFNTSDDDEEEGARVSMERTLAPDKRTLMQRIRDAVVGTPPPPRKEVIIVRVSGAGSPMNSPR